MIDLRPTANGLLVESPAPFVVQAVQATGGQPWDCWWEAFAAMPDPVRGGGAVAVLCGAGTVDVRFYEPGGLRCERVTYGGPADFDLDGDIGTDRDIAAFFACLAHGCADFDDDGSPGTDADIRCFFRAIAGGAC